MPTPPKPDWSPHQKNLQMVFFLIRRANSPLHLVSCKQKRSTFRRVSILTVSLALPLIVPTFTVPKRIRLFPAGLPSWPDVACINNSSILDTTFIQYWSVKFYGRMPFLTQTRIKPRKPSIFTWDTISPKNTSSKNNMPSVRSIPKTKEGI